MKSTQPIVALAAILGLGMVGVASAHDNRDRHYRDNPRHSHATHQQEHRRKVHRQAHRNWRQAKRAERRHWRAHRREARRDLRHWRAHERRDWRAVQRYSRDYRYRDSNSVTFWVDGVRFHIADAR